MSTSRRSTSGRGPAQAPNGARRPRVAGLRSRPRQEPGAESSAQDTRVDEVEDTEVDEVDDTDDTQVEDTQVAEVEDTEVDDTDDTDDTQVEDTRSARAPSEGNDPEVAEVSDPDSVGGERRSGLSYEGEGSPHLATNPAPEESGTAGQESGTAGPAGRDAGTRRLRDRLERRPVPLIAVLLVLTAAFGGLAFWFHSEAYSLRYEGAAANRALVDQAATSKVKGQVTDAVETLFSYDYANTAKTEKAAKNLLTGEAVQQYDKLFAVVEKQAPKQKLVLTTTVGAASVTQLQGDRAEVLLFVNQDVTSTKSGQRSAAPGIIIVSAVNKDGQWKISGLRQPPR